MSICCVRKRRRRLMGRGESTFSVIFLKENQIWLWVFCIFGRNLVFETQPRRKKMLKSKLSEIFLGSWCVSYLSRTKRISEQMSLKFLSVLPFSENIFYASGCNMNLFNIIIFGCSAVKIIIINCTTHNFSSVTKHVRQMFKLQTMVQCTNICYFLNTLKLVEVQYLQFVLLYSWNQVFFFLFFQLSFFLVWYKITPIKQIKSMLKR